MIDFLFFFTDIGTWEACTVTRKLDPDLMFEMSNTHNKGQKYGMEFTFFLLLFNFCCCVYNCASYDPVWMILVIFVTYNGVLSVPRISDRLLGYYPLSLDHHHIFALIIITSACQHELRLLLFVCVCGADEGDLL